MRCASDDWRVKTRGGFWQATVLWLVARIVAYQSAEVSEQLL